MPRTLTQAEPGVAPVGHSNAAGAVRDIASLAGAGPVARNPPDVARARRPATPRNASSRICGTLAAWLSARSGTVPAQAVADQAKAMASTLGLDDFAASPMWLAAFLRRFPDLKAKVLPGPKSAPIKRKRMSLQEQIEIIDGVAAGASQVSMAARYGVRRQTVCKILQRSDVLRAEMQHQQTRGNSTTSLTRRTLTAVFPTKAIDDALVDWMRAHSGRVTNTLLQTKAKEIADTLGMHEFKASGGWLRRFSLRNGLNLRRPKQLGNPIESPQADVRDDSSSGSDDQDDDDQDADDQDADDQDTDDQDGAVKAIDAAIDAMQGIPGMQADAAENRAAEDASAMNNPAMTWQPPVPPANPPPSTVAAIDAYRCLRAYVTVRGDVRAMGELDELYRRLLQPPNIVHL
ncbi:hypothetical protein SDRG_08775 [Saprolegnia diclina VS20]|uniref:HTH CENPB-type domain-containing protein n=1 Tax=Saprolegnia diclina (strain VS20) TaxID=1156394 RepID=T0QG03_SAPDV|nr:hypothetical protein SDRG_08775 [Saprolegnia diclina VS20]EQC33671.1 hypothetical protein SDRG_08775 [Saprolegnia diclina VS20]|eukprot:XP_008612894.1 hypothetical protein SDRG_08775 [Saprolegnia diclina VS20]